MMCATQLYRIPNPSKTRNVNMMCATQLYRIPNPDMIIIKTCMQLHQKKLCNIHFIKHNY